jgi:acyl carrier protein
MGSREMNAFEQAVAAIWAEFLDADDIDVDDDFFDLGGNSLALISVVMTMGERFGLPLDTSIVLEGATVASLAKCVQRQISARDLAGRASDRNPAAISGD